MRKQRFTDAKIKQALRASFGGVYLAADMLQCSHTTIYNRINASPALQEAKEHAEERLVDIAVAGLGKAVVGGEAWAIKYALDKKGKQRGYAETTQHEHSGAQGKPIQVELANLRAALLHDGNYLEYQRARACDADADPRDFRADGEPGALADESPSASLGSQAD